MMTVIEKSNERKHAVQKDVEDLIASSQRYMQANELGDEEAKIDLQMKASHLIQTLRGPVPSALSHFEDVSLRPDSPCSHILTSD